jgi:hypothetical protein
MGWLSLAADTPKKAAAGEPSAASEERIAEAFNNLAAVVKGQAPSPQIETPCDPNDNIRSSDLCAQWKAADAAKSAASAAWWMGVIGALLGGATLWVAVRAALWAKKAALHTEAGSKEAQRAADAAERSLEIAQDTAKRELRAYVSLLKATMPKFVVDNDSIDVVMHVENSGSTPANYFFGQIAWRVTDQEPTAELFNQAVAEYAPEPDAQIVCTIGPRQRRELPYPITVPDEWRTKVLSGEMQFYFMGKLRYRDVFEDHHVTEFFYVYTTNHPNHLRQAHACNHTG